MDIPPPMGYSFRPADYMLEVKLINSETTVHRQHHEIQNMNFHINYGICEPFLITVVAPECGIS